MMITILGMILADTGTSDVVRIKLKYVIEDEDRYGNIRRYFRRKGQPKIRLPGIPGSKEFMDAYDAALKGVQENQRQLRPPAKGSFGFVCQAYYADPLFHTLDPSTQAWRRRALDVICEKHGDKPIALMKAKHIFALRNELTKLPGAARTRLKSLKALFKWALEKGEVEHNPCLGIAMFSYKENPIHTWTLEEVEKYRERHPVGTMARLAMELSLYTACRREDAVRFGPHNIKNGQTVYGGRVREQNA